MGPVQYLQFSEWQNELVEGEEPDAEPARAFWRKQDFSSLAALNLPLEITLEDDTAAGNQSGRRGDRSPGGGEDRGGGPGARDEPSGFPAGLLAGAALAGFTGRPEISMGLVSHGRRYEELHGAMGLFARCLPVTVAFEEDRPFIELLARSRRGGPGAWDWQEYFVPGADELSFPVGFEEQERPPRDETAGLSWTVDRQQCVAESFKLKLTCVSGDGQPVAAEIDYDPRRYN